MSHRITIESLPPEHYEKIQKVISSEKAQEILKYLYDAEPNTDSTVQNSENNI